MHSHDMDGTPDSGRTPYVRGCTTSHNVVRRRCDTRGLILIPLQRARTDILGGADSLVGADNLAARRRIERHTSRRHVIFTRQRSTPPYPTLAAVITPTDDIASPGDHKPARKVRRKNPPTSRDARRSRQQVT